MCESGTHASHSKEEEEEEEERKKGVLAKSIFKSFPPKRLPGPLVKPLFIPSASVFDKTKQHNSQKQRRPEREGEGEGEGEGFQNAYMCFRLYCGASLLPPIMMRTFGPVGRNLRFFRTPPEGGGLLGHSEPLCLGVAKGTSTSNKRKRVDFFVVFFLVVCFFNNVYKKTNLSFNWPMSERNVTSKSLLLGD
jgi:hypothetical protein